MTTNAMTKRMPSLAATILGLWTKHAVKDSLTCDNENSDNMLVDQEEGNFSLIVILKRIHFSH
jgi:hypothetical protein